MLLALGIAAAIGIGVLAATSGGEDGGGTKEGAIDVCRQFVEQRLNAPATAEFSAETATGELGAWTVHGTVDAENQLGVPLRNYYKCEVELVEDRRWRATGPLLVGDAPYK